MKRLYSPSKMKAVLEEHGFHFSKALGQNFLIDGNIVRGICEKAGITEEDVVIEIGPGIGTLTEELLLRAKKVIAIELDQRLIPILEENLGHHDNFVLIQGDALKVDLQEILQQEAPGEEVCLVANLPYYITTPILSRFLEEDIPLKSATVMVQAEVADRMVADETSKDYGSLSLFIRYYSKPEVVLNVPKEVFLPRPKVDSKVVHMEMQEPKGDKDLFFKLVHAGFNQRRKTILNSLTQKSTGITKQELRKALEELNLETNLRAENLSLQNYLDLADCLNRESQGITDRTE